MPAVKQAASGDAVLHLDRLAVVVDHQAEPVDLDQVLNALDRLVEWRLKQRTTAAPGGTLPETVDLTTATERRTA